MDILKLAAAIELFEGLPKAQVATLAGLAVLRAVARGQEIFQTGDEAEGFYAVGTGKVKVYSLSQGGKEQIIHVFGPGDTFAEVAVFEGGVYPACAAALEDSELLFFPRRAIREAIRKDPDLAMNMLGLMAGRLRILVKKVEQVSLKEVPSRLADYLLKLHREQGGPELRLDLQKGQIASSIGTIQETLSRTLKRFGEQGLIAMQGRSVTITDLEGLKRLAQEDGM